MKVCPGLRYLVIILELLDDEDIGRGIARLVEFHFVYLAVTLLPLFDARGSQGLHGLQVCVRVFCELVH